MNDDTRALIERYFDGGLSAEETANLERLIAAEPSIAAAVCAFAVRDQQLRQYFAQAAPPSLAGQLQEMEARPPRSNWSRRWMGLGALAATVLALCSAALYWQSSKNPPAHIVRSGEVHVDGHVVRTAPSGAALQIVGEQSAEIALADGSSAKLDPRTRAVIRDGDERLLVELLDGGGVFKVANGDAPFTVDTAQGRVTAVGTEFSVRLVPSPSGESAMNVRQVSMLVVVLSGLVQVDAGTNTVLIGAGERRAFGEEGREKPKGKEVRGTIVEFDASLFKLQSGGDSKQELTYNLTQDTAVTIDRRPAKLFDLKADMRVVVQLNADGSSVFAIHAAGPTTFGNLRAVDSEKKTITLYRKPDEKGRVANGEYPVADDIAVTIDGRPAKLTELQPDIHVSLQLGVDGKTAIAATQRIKKEEEKGRKPDYETARGVVTNVDPTGRTISVTRQSEGGQKTTTVSVDKEAAISVDGDAVPLEKLTTGREATVNYRGEKPIAFKITIGQKKEGEGRRK